MVHHYLQSESDAFLAHLRKDMHFWRMVFERSHLLITRMIAVAMITDNIHALSYGLKTGHITADMLNEDRSWFAPLTRLEADMGRVFVFEYRGALNALEAVEEEGLSWLNFYQPRASQNLNYTRVAEPLMKVAAMSASEFMSYQSSAQAREDFSPVFTWKPSVLYNPVGKELLSHSMPAYSNYFVRVHDLDGMLRLLNLHLELVSQSASPKLAVINQSKWVNPYDLSPFKWDQQRQQIYFECQDHTSVCELSL